MYNKHLWIHAANFFSFLQVCKYILFYHKQSNVLKKESLGFYLILFFFVGMQNQCFQFLWFVTFLYQVFESQFLATSPTGCPEKFDFTNRKKFEFMFGLKFGVQFLSDQIWVKVGHLNQELWYAFKNQNLLGHPVVIKYNIAFRSFEA